jgi:Cu(I)/Ag(I) efflux system membrane fusion protein
MNRRTLALVASVSVISAALTFGALKISGSGGASVTKQDGPKIMYWVAPMDPNYRRDQPGKSPMGMDLIPVYEGEQNSADDAGVLVPPSIVNNIGVREGSVKRRDLIQDIHAVGYLGYDENKVSHVHIRAEGWIENLAVKTVGERVRKGQLLFEYYAPDLVNAQAEYLQAVRSGRALLVRASKERLRLLGLSQQQIEVLHRTRTVQNRVKVLATQDGVISQMDVREGMFVSPNITIMTLADLSSVWMLVDVFERQAMAVEKGQTAKVSFSYAPGKTWPGVIEYIYPIVDPVTRTFKARIRLDNPDETLKPNMYGRVQIAGKSHSGVLTVPSEALIRSGRMNRVVLSLGDGRFKAVEVLSGIEANGLVEIKEGLEEGAKVVTSGQFLIDSEANLNGSIQRLTSAESVDELAPAETTPPTAKAVINSLMPDHNMVNVTHEPIPDLGWPEMTMDFKLLEGASLDGLQVGQSVMITLKKDTDGMYALSGIQSAQKPEILASGKGVINTVSTDAKTLNITHAPIKSLGWPEMTMDFQMGPGIDVSGFQSGDAVQFDLTKDKEGMFIIGDIRVEHGGH